jgi:hypothetical protein
LQDLLRSHLSASRFPHSRSAEAAVTLAVVAVSMVGAAAAFTVEVVFHTAVVFTEADSPVAAITAEAGSVEAIHSLAVAVPMEECEEEPLHFEVAAARIAHGVQKAVVSATLHRAGMDLSMVLTRAI